MTTILVGPLSTKYAVTGMRVAFDLLVSGFRTRSLKHIVVNRSEVGGNEKAGKFSFGKSLYTLKLLLSFYTKLWRAKIVYIAIGTSRAGFVRDALMIWPSWLLKKRLVIHLHGGGFQDFYQESPKWLRFFMRHTFSKVNTFLVLGELLRDQFNFVKESAKKTHVVANSLYGKFEDITRKPKELSPKKALKILYLSNMIPSKGYLDVLEACHILHNLRPTPIQCDFCGSFFQVVADKTNLKLAKKHFIERIKDYKLENVVKYHGTVRGHEKKNILQNAHVFILPTYYPWEGQPISIIEALAFGTPVISTRYRGIPEQVQDGYNGFLIPARSPEKIATIIEKLWRSPQLYFQISENALNHFKKFFTQEAHLNRIIPLILGENDSTNVL